MPLIPLTLGTFENPDFELNLEIHKTIQTIIILE